MARASAGLRDLLHKVHRWLGLALFVLITPVAVSGALLVFHDELDAVMNPARYAVSGDNLLAPSAYLTSAVAALDAGALALSVRFPEHDGTPVKVQARIGENQGASRLMIVFLDPPTARVLDVVDFRSSLFGFLHRFHENLTIPQYSGRAIVGWIGVGLLLLSLTGIVLWWPRNGSLMRALRWRRRPATSTNMHYAFGFWISLPLAFVSLTGIYLSFPPQARTVMSSIVPTAPQRPRVFAMPVRNPALTADQALAIASRAAAGARPVALFVPTARRGDAEARPQWRAQFETQADGTQTILVDDRNGTARQQPAALPGDRAAQWIRWLHDGSRGGPVWRVVVLLTGILPPVFGVTGIMMWLRGRKRAARAAGALLAAE